MAVLSCSCFTYAEACDDMKLENWISCHVHAYNYFGGVTRLLVPDNLKTGITKNTRYETVLNRTYQEMAEYSRYYPEFRIIATEGSNTPTALSTTSSCRQA